MSLIFSLKIISGFFFFFSSRRRHTRLQGDWSSDVCSSDLRRQGRVRGGGPRASARESPRCVEAHLGPRYAPRARAERPARTHAAVERQVREEPTVTNRPPDAQLAHVGLFVRDLDAMIAFYTRVLGLVVTDSGDYYMGGRIAFL